jgi:hypothetical protein
MMSSRLQPAHAAVLRLGAALIAAGAAFAAPGAHAFSFTIGGESVTGSGHVASQQRAVTGFDAVRSEGSIDVVVRQGAKEGVTVTADDNLLPLIETRVVSEGRGGHALVITTRRGANLSTHDKMTVTVDAVQLHAVSVSGSGDLRIESFTTPALAVDLSGSGDAHLGRLETQDLAVSVAGSGDVDGGGHAAHLKIDIAGSGDVKLPQLQADDVKVSIAGSGDADVVANHELAVSIAGSGDVVYHGTGTLVSSSVVGSGGVKHR